MKCERCRAVELALRGCINRLYNQGGDISAFTHEANMLTAKAAEAALAMKHAHPLTPIRSRTAASPRRSIAGTEPTSPEDPRPADDLSFFPSSAVYYGNRSAWTEGGPCPRTFSVFQA
jgi:hypothetical protein